MAQRESGAESKSAPQNKRKHDRRKSYWPVMLHSRLLDLSEGGVALEMSFQIPDGTPLQICISPADPHLKELDAMVVGCRESRSKEFIIHTKFVNLTPSVERALKKYIMFVQPGLWKAVSDE